MIEFINNNGGRKTAGFKGAAGDGVLHLLRVRILDREGRSLMRFEDCTSQNEQITVLHQLWKVQHEVLHEHETALIDLLALIGQQGEHVNKLTSLVEESEKSINHGANGMIEALRLIREDRVVVESYAATLEATRMKLEALLTE